MEKKELSNVCTDQIVNMHKVMEAYAAGGGIRLNASIAHKQQIAIGIRQAGYFTASRHPVVCAKVHRL